MKNIKHIKNTWMTASGISTFRRFALFGAVAGTLLLVSACSDSGHDMMGSGHNLKMGEHWFSAEEVAKGEAIYTKNCAKCHGYKGKASFNWRQKLADGSYPPPPLNGTGHTWHHNYAHLLDQITNGGIGRGGKMPPFKNILSEDQRVSVLAYIQSLWSDEIYQRWQMGAKHTM
jgi:cytochrome c